jgi:hypothetical protein
MTFEQLVLKRISALSPQKQRELLDFLASIEKENARPRPRKSLRGLWKNSGLTITFEDIAEARREMWGNFPRDVE